MGDAEIGAEVLLDLGSAELRISVGVEQTGFGGEQGAEPVYVDRPPFHDDVRIEDWQFQFIGDEGRDDIIEVERRVLAAPGVEFPVYHSLGACPWVLLLDKDRTMVTNPGVV